MFVMSRPGSKYHDVGDIVSGQLPNPFWTIDESWHLQDLSSIVGVGVRFVLIQGGLISTAANDYMKMRTPGNVNEGNIALFQCPTAGALYVSEQWILTDNAGRVQYKAGVAATYGSGDFTIRAYFS